MICTGTIFFSAPSSLLDGVTETAGDVRQLDRTVRRVRRTLSGILVYMRSDGLPIDDVTRDAFLICANGCDNAESSRVDLLAPIANDADNDFLPTVLAPSLATISLT